MSVGRRPQNSLSIVMASWAAPSGGGKKILFQVTFRSNLVRSVVESAAVFLRKICSFTTTNGQFSIPIGRKMEFTGWSNMRNAIFAKTEI